MPIVATCGLCVCERYTYNVKMIILRAKQVDSIHLTLHFFRALVLMKAKKLKMLLNFHENTVSKFCSICGLEMMPLSKGNCISPRLHELRGAESLNHPCS